ncbi:tape measure protein [Phascolarctobacterium faecium]
MKLRELLIGIGFKVNEQNINAVESKIGKIKKNLSEVGTASTRAADMTSKGMATVGNASERTKQKTESAFSSIESKARGANEELHKMDSTLTGLKNKFVGALAFLGVTLSLGNIIRMVDEWKVVNGQVALTTKNQQESLMVQKELYRMAIDTRQAYASTATLYASVARNSSELGKSAEDVLGFTEDVSRAMMIGGGSAASQQAALIQLGQALGSGVLRGDELNSIMEQAPRLAKAIAEGMGTTIGQLRVLGKEGKLTAIDVFDAIRKSSEKLKREMGKIPWTVNQAGVRVSNALGNLFSKLEKKTGVVSSIAKGFASIGDYIDNIDIDNFVAGFQLLVIYASAFFVVSKWNSLLTGMKLLKDVILGIKDAYLLATGAQVVFRSGSARSIAMAILPFAKIALIAAAIAIVILAIQDLYVWIQGGDSIIGRHVGSWKDFIKELSRRWEQLKDEFSKSIAPLVSAIQPFINTFKDIVNWIDSCISKFESFQAKIAAWNPRKKLSEFGDWVGNIYLGGANKNTGNDYIAKSVARSNTRNYSDQSTHTNNINIFAKTNATPAEIGVGVANAIEPANGYEFDLSSGFDYDFPILEDN